MLKYPNQGSVPLLLISKPGCHQTQVCLFLPAMIQLNEQQIILNSLLSLFGRSIENELILLNNVMRTICSIGLNPPLSLKPTVLKHFQAPVLTLHYMELVKQTLKKPMKRSPGSTKIKAHSPLLALRERVEKNVKTQNEPCHENDYMG